MYTKWPENGGEINQMGIKYIGAARPSKIYPNWDFWLENKPSGNPAAISHYDDLWTGNTSLNSRTDGEGPD
jgi:NADH:ubiquinone oxidoreductase subunit